jgi:uncharacterized repeat protein (TIGR01451 family)
MARFSKLGATLAVCTAALAMSSPALGAASPCGTSGVYGTSGTTATCTYSSTGSEDAFTVLAGISTVEVTAVGGQGGNSDYDGGPTGGLGAQVSDTALPIPAGVATLYVDVGENAPQAAPGQVEVGQFPDGGIGACGRVCAAGGGGSSALLSTPRATAQLDNELTGDPSTDARLLVAAGGGGASEFGDGANAGDTDVSGAGAGGCQGGPGDAGDGGVGPIDGTDGGGAACLGARGTASIAGSGAGSYYGGGGGGGGWFGGGGGDPTDGGGGGSSYGGAGPSSAVSIAMASLVQQPGVVISWTLVATSLSYTGPRSGTYGTPVTVSAMLTSGGSPLGSEPVSISFGAESCEGTTSPASGVASCQITPTDAPSGGLYPIDASFAGANGYVASSDTSRSFALAAATPVISWSTPSAITLGTALSSIQLDASATDPNTGASVPGTFSYTPPSGKVLSAGQRQPLSVSFTPSSGEYTPARQSTTITVNQATPTLANAVHDAGTGAAWSGAELPGAKAYDTAALGHLVAGIIPSKSVKYSLYANGLCSGTAQTNQTVSLNANGAVPNSASTTALKAGNYSYLAGYSGDPNYLAASSCQPFTVAPDAADVSVTISGPASAAENATFTETVTVKNNGPAAATNVITALIVPGGVTVKNAGGGSPALGSLIWSAASILPGTSKTYTVTFTVGAHTKATVLIGAAAASLTVPDPNYTNNAAARTITLGPSTTNNTTLHNNLTHRPHNPLAIGQRLITHLKQLNHHTNHRPR